MTPLTPEYLREVRERCDAAIPHYDEFLNCGTLSFADRSAVTNFVINAAKIVPTLLDAYELAAGTLETVTKGSFDGMQALANDMAVLRAERDALKARLSSGLCSAHMEPDPLNCDMCDKVSWLTSANVDRMAQIDALKAERDSERQIKEAEKKILLEEIAENQALKAEADALASLVQRSLELIPKYPHPWTNEYEFRKEAEAALAAYREGKL
jgi:hypothetical protein